MSNGKNPFHKSKYIDRISKNLQSLMLGEGLGTGRGGSKLSDLALMQQRLSAGRYNEAQTAFTEAETTGQLSENEKLAAQALAIKNATDNSTFSKMFGSNASLANIAAAHPQWFKVLAEGLTENELRGGKVNQQDMMSQAMQMFLPETPEARSARELQGNSPHTEGELMRAFSLLSKNPSGAGDSFTMADKQGVRDSDAYKVGQLSDKAKATKIEKETAPAVDLIKSKIAGEKGKTSLTSAEKTRVETLSPLEAALLEAKTEQVTGATATAKELGQAKITTEGSRNWLVTAQSMKEVAMRTAVEQKQVNDQVAAGKMALQIEAKTALHWAGVDKFIADIANAEYESALNGLLTHEKTLSVKAESDAKVGLTNQQTEEVKQDIKRIKELINNLKSTGKHIEAEIDQTNAGTTLINQKTDVQVQEAKSKIAETMLFDTKTRGEEWKLFEDMNDGISGPAGTGGGDFKKTREGTRIAADAADTMAEKYPVGVELNAEGNEVTAYTHLDPLIGKKVRGILNPGGSFPKNKKDQRKVVQAAKRILNQTHNPKEVKAILKVMLEVEDDKAWYEF
jgi:hypothetical protein